MSNFWLLVLSFLLIVTNFQISFGLKCEFPAENYHALYNSNEDRHFCSIISDSSDTIQDFDKESVSFVEYNGEKFGSLDISYSDFPICDEFQNIRHLTITNVKSVDAGFFKKCENLFKIKVVSSEIKEIPEDFYSENLSVYSINMEKNMLTTLPEKVFSHLEELQYIDLSDNQISSLPLNIFKSLPNLERIYMSNNKIQKLHPGLFDGVVSLQGILLSNNGIKDLPKNIFTSLINLDTLYLSDNELSVIHSDSFGIHKKLQDVSLNGNKIYAIDEKFFDNTSIESWHMLDMGDNVCIEETVYNKGQNMREMFKKCFENYQLREE